MFIFLLYCLVGLTFHVFILLTFRVFSYYFFKNCSDICVGSLPFFFFFATVSCYMAVSCSFTALKIGGGGLGELVSSVFRLFVFFLHCLFF